MLCEKKKTIKKVVNIVQTTNKNVAWTRILKLVYIIQRVVPTLNFKISLLPGKII